jgi:hypothetical protein
MLLEHDQIVKHSHHRPFGDKRRFLVDRHARRAVGTVHFQDAAGLLSQRRLGRHGDEQ